MRRAQKVPVLLVTRYFIVKVLLPAGRLRKSHTAARIDTARIRGVVGERGEVGGVEAVASPAVTTLYEA